MDPNPALQKLGFSPKDRIAIIHTDDIGMCQASVAAFADLWEFSSISSGATMVPCPWFPQAAAYCREHPGVDMGVHMTLTSEWETYRWGPISTNDIASGMIDSEGFFYHSSEQAQEFGNPAAVQHEMSTQVERAKAFGINPTHIDTHMGTVAHPKFMPAYIQLGQHYQTPLMIMRMDEQGWLDFGLDTNSAAIAGQLVAQFDDMGFPMIDHMAGLELDKAKTLEERINYAKQTLSQLKSGITHFIIHPSKDSPELRAITPDWPCRVADYQAFMSQELKTYISEIGIQVIGYQALQDLIPVTK